MGQGTSLRAIRAMRWILDNAAKYNIKVVNLSIGTNDRRVHRPLQEAVESLWHKGIVVVAAAANPGWRRTLSAAAIPQSQHSFCGYMGGQRMVSLKTDHIRRSA